MSNSKNQTKHEIPSLKSLERDFGQKFAYPASTKTYLQGSRSDIKAPIRMIEQLPTRVGEELIANPPVPVYDTSGPYSDPEIVINLEKGLPRLRDGWISERNDTEQLSGPSSEYGVLAPRMKQLKIYALHISVHHVWQRLAKTSVRCITHDKASLLVKWNTWPYVNRWA